MMRSLNQWLLLPVVAIFLSVQAIAAEGWETNIDAAVAKAKAENKHVMVKFTGSDWCPPCQMIQKAVFSKQSFVDEASKTYILCIIDSPRQDKKLAKKNQPLLKKHAIMGFPTVLLLDGSGKEFSRYNPAAFPTVKEMISQLAFQLRRKDMF